MTSGKVKRRTHKLTQRQGLAAERRNTQNAYQKLLQEGCNLRYIFTSSCPTVTPWRVTFTM